MDFNILLKICTMIFNFKFIPSAQDRGPFLFSYILNELLQYIEIWNEFKVLNRCTIF